MRQSYIVEAEEGMSVKCTVDYTDKDNAVIIERLEHDTSQVISLSAEEARRIVKFLTGTIPRHII